MGFRGSHKKNTWAEGLLLGGALTGFCVCGTYTHYLLDNRCRFLGRLDGGLSFFGVSSTSDTTFKYVFCWRVMKRARDLATRVCVVRTCNILLLLALIP